MTRFLSPFCLLAFTLHLLVSGAPLAAAEPPPPAGKGVSLFDGATLGGWEGNPRLWKVQDGALTGGSLTETVVHNDFLATTRNYTNFIVRLQIRLTGTEGFLNSGFQIRSQRVPGSTEMAGYQCDFGEPSWYGCVYDESRRNKLMAASDMAALRPVIRQGDWNDYVIRADGPRITTWINGVMGVDYHEPDLTLPNYGWGRMGIQVHGGGKALAQVRNITVEELPARIEFIGAADPATPARPSPQSPDEEQASFSLPPGFQIELVASEDMAAGLGKFVGIDWDIQGRLWTMTALEYPVDANESPEVARELYASRARDKVLVFDRDATTPTGYSAKARVFADGLAIPLGILPYKDGAYVQHGQEIVFLRDSDGDGRADQRQLMLGGFGVQDSHLFPHQFTRAPGNWIWFAQGAFNYGKVRTTRGAEVQFDQTRMAKFRYDASEFEITSQGPCNIWGLVLDGNGQAWIQEANDFGYPMMPFHEFANYPGCSGAQWKSYAPEFPGTTPEFAMGGTGLSGLALSDASAWPAPYNNTFYIANPITRKIQAIRVTPDGTGFRYQKLPDFVLSGDEWFRPVALRNGPDGCLYIVDWYNKIISHNEVPRNHPERDKKRGRIWRVRHTTQKPHEVADLSRITPEAVLEKLGGPSLQQSHLAWQAIVDRDLKSLLPSLKTLVLDGKTPAPRRLAALWAMEGLKGVELPILNALLADTNRNVRREAVRALGQVGRDVALLEPVRNDTDPEVRSEVIRSAGRMLAASATGGGTASAVRFIVSMAGDPLSEPVTRSTQSGKVILDGEAYRRAFERYLVRLHLEPYPSAVAAFLKSTEAATLPPESLLLASLTLEPAVSATEVAALLPRLGRAPGDEELLRLAQFPESRQAGEALRALLKHPASRDGTLESLLRVRTRLDGAKLAPLLLEAARDLLSQNSTATMALGTRLASAFQLAGAEPELVRVLEAGVSGPGPLMLRPESLDALRALRDIRSDQVERFAQLAERGVPQVREVAAGALAASRNPDGPARLAALYPALPATLRRTTLTALAGTPAGARAAIHAVRDGRIPRDDLDGLVFDKLQAVLGNDAELAALLQELSHLFRPVLRLNGEDNAWSETGVDLEGTFTLETWVKLDAGIDNNDSIAAAPGSLDLNFFDSRFRVWVGGGIHDAIVARKRMTPDVWTHIALTRDSASRLRIYINGELDNDAGKPVEGTFKQIRVGWSGPARGTAGWLSEFRIWKGARTHDQIRAEFDRSYSGTTNVPGLVRVLSGTDWGRLQPGARIVKTPDFPALMTGAEAAALAEKFSRFQGLAAGSGNISHGQSLFSAACQGCHSVGGNGGQVGPVLNGAGALGVEALLRNILTPNAAMEPGYRVFRVELKDGDVLDGILVSQDAEVIVLRRPNVQDTRIPQSDVRRAGHTRTSMMPEGLLEGMQPDDVTDLFTYLKTLK